jgi:hypothetical protein
MVRRNKQNPFNTSSRYVFLDDCYEGPVVVWPHDPLNKLAAGYREKNWFHIINRNQVWLYDEEN